MSDDIKSMIKSRRDERYYGSSFEKRNKYTDETRMDAIQHHMDTATDDTSPDEISTMIGDYNRARRDSDLNSGRSVDDPNPVPKEQPKLDEIPANAGKYVEERARSKFSINDLEKFRQPLLDKGFSEEDLQTFQRIYDALGEERQTVWGDALNNAARISYARMGEDHEQDGY